MPSNSPYQGTDKVVAFPIYLDTPPRDRFFNVALRSAPYFILTILALVSMFRTDQIYHEFLPDWASIINGIFLLISSAVAFKAVVRGHFRIEYGLLWFIAGSFSIIMWASWFTVVKGSLSDLTFALSCTLVFLFLTYRGFRLSLEVRAHVALRKKELHALLLVEEENESRTDSGGD